MAIDALLFDAPLRKLRWGRHRIGEFQWHLQQYELSNPTKQKHTDTEIIVEREKSPPDELALVLGDAIHNLRATLDLLAADLVRRNGGNLKGVYFPFAASAAGLDEQIRSKKFDRAGEAAVQQLHRLAPYRGGNEALRGLHDLDIMDKHQLIIPAFQGFRMLNFLLKGPSGEMVGDASGPGDGISISATPDDKLTWDSLEFTVVFGQGVPSIFFGKPIVSTLQDLAKLVDHVVASFRVCPTDNANDG
jgi:hypothetical protein